MSLAVIAGSIPHAHKPRREKMFGAGKCVPLDRNAKARIMTLARALMRRTEERKHYGVLTAKFVAVLAALVWGFHNAATGRCFPSYERIAEQADCSRATVYKAIIALEEAGLLTWVHRIARIREWGPDLFGRAQNRIRVIRTSNAYRLIDPKASESKIQTGTEGQELLSSARPSLDPKNRLHAALLRLGKEVKGAAPTGAAGLAG